MKEFALGITLLAISVAFFFTVVGGMPVLEAGRTVLDQ